MKENITKREFLVPSDLSQVQSESAKVLSFLEPLGLSEGHRFDIRLCIEEALINAIKYGNRLQKNLSVRLVAEYDSDAVRVSVEDQGDGFDPSTIKDCTKAGNVLRGHGRGLHLIYQLMDQVKFNEKGNRILMVKSLRKPAR